MTAADTDAIGNLIVKVGGTPADVGAVIGSAMPGVGAFFTPEEREAPPGGPATPMLVAAVQFQLVNKNGPGSAILDAAGITANAPGFVPAGRPDAELQVPGYFVTAIVTDKPISLTGDRTEIGVVGLAVAQGTQPEIFESPRGQPWNFLNNTNRADLIVPNEAGDGWVLAVAAFKDGRYSPVRSNAFAWIDGRTVFIFRPFNEGPFQAARAVTDARTGDGATQRIKSDAIPPITQPPLLQSGPAVAVTPPVKPADTPPPVKPVDTTPPVKPADTPPPVTTPTEPSANGDGSSSWVVIAVVVLIALLVGGWLLFGRRRQPTTATTPTDTPPPVAPPPSTGKAPAECAPLVERCRALTRRWRVLDAERMRLLEAKERLDRKLAETQDRLAAAKARTTADSAALVAAQQQLTAFGDGPLDQAGQAAKAAAEANVAEQQRRVTDDEDFEARLQKEVDLSADQAAAAAEAYNAAWQAMINASGEAEEACALAAECTGSPVDGDSPSDPQPPSGLHTFSPPAKPGEATENLTPSDPGAPPDAEQDLADQQLRKELADEQLQQGDDAAYHPPVSVFTPAVDTTGELKDKPITSPVHPVLPPFKPEPFVWTYIDGLVDDWASGDMGGRIPTFIEHMYDGFGKAAQNFVGSLKVAYDGWRNMTSEQLASLPDAVKQAFNDLKKKLDKLADLATKDDGGQAFAAEMGELTGDIEFQVTLGKVIDAVAGKGLSYLDDGPKGKPGAPGGGGAGEGAGEGAGKGASPGEGAGAGSKPGTTPGETPPADAPGGAATAPDPIDEMLAEADRQIAAGEIDPESGAGMKFPRPGATMDAFDAAKMAARERLRDARLAGPLKESERALLEAGQAGDVAELSKQPQAFWDDPLISPNDKAVLNDAERRRRGPGRGWLGQWSRRWRIDDHGEPEDRDDHGQRAACGRRHDHQGGPTDRHAPAEGHPVPAVRHDSGGTAEGTRTAGYAAGPGSPADPRIAATRHAARDAAVGW